MTPRRGKLTLEQEGQGIVERLGGRWSGGGGICRCPAHDDRTPSLSVRVGRTRLLLHCFAGCPADDVLRALQSERLIDPQGAAGEKAGHRDSRGTLRRAARRIWEQSRSIAGTPAEAYLASRGLASDSAQLRYHPLTPHGPAPFTRFRPALVAAIRDESGLVAIHRTFIDDAAEHASDTRRCGLGHYGSGAVRLGEGSRRLGLAEGVETALSAAALFGVPCWATLGSERFGGVALPTQTRELLLFLDNDEGGHRAEALARRAYGAAIQIAAFYPPRAGGDWNDVLRSMPIKSLDAAIEFLRSWATHAAVQSTFVDSNCALRESGCSKSPALIDENHPHARPILRPCRSPLFDDRAL